MVGVMEAWLMELKALSESTRRQYLDHFQRFCKRWGKTPDEIYDLYANAETPRARRFFQNMLKRHMKEMRDSGRSASTCRMAYKAVSSFFKAQGIRFKIGSRELPRGQYNGQRRIKRDQIAKLYDVVGPEFRLRNRALIMFLKDSGLRISDAAKLNVSDYLNARTIVHEGEKFKVFEPFETVKSRVYAYIHIGPEAVNAIDEYLEERKPEPDEPLFTMRDGRRFTTGALSNVFFRLTRKLGKEGQRISAHSFRKFHTTELEAKMNSSWIAKLQGKSLERGWVAYSKPEGDGREIDQNMLTEAYIKAYDDALRIKISEARQRRTQQKMVESLQQRVKELEKALEDERKKHVSQLNELSQDLMAKFEVRLKEELKRNINETYGPLDQKIEGWKFLIRNQLRMERREIEFGKQTIKKAKKEGKDTTLLEKIIREKEMWLQMKIQAYKKMIQEPLDRL